MQLFQGLHSNIQSINLDNDNRDAIQQQIIGAIKSSIKNRKLMLSKQESDLLQVLRAKSQVEKQLQALKQINVAKCQERL